MSDRRRLVLHQWRVCRPSASPDAGPGPTQRQLSKRSIRRDRPSHHAVPLLAIRRGDGRGALARCETGNGRHTIGPDSRSDEFHLHQPRPCATDRERRMGARRRDPHRSSNDRVGQVRLYRARTRPRSILPRRPSLLARAAVGADPASHVGRADQGAGERRCVDEVLVEHLQSQHVRIWSRRPRNASPTVCCENGIIRFTSKIASR